MRKQYLRILIALFSVAGLGVVAEGQVRDQIVVTIPYEFVVAGKILPAGTYKVNRVNDTDPRALILSSLENRASAFILPTEVENSHADKAEVGFEQVGGERFLTKIETAEHRFTISVSRSEILEATGRSNSGTSASGTASGSN